MTALSEMKTIRVLVQGGRGNGHKRSAITAMLWLRRAGFQGVFHLYCQDSATITNGKKTVNLLEDSGGHHQASTYNSIMKMLGLKMVADGHEDSDEIIDSPVGKIKVSTLDKDLRAEPEPADLSITVGESVFNKKQPEFEYEYCSLIKGALEFLTKNSPYLVSLSPTDWFGFDKRAFPITVTTRDEGGELFSKCIGSSDKMRLSSYSHPSHIVEPKNLSRSEGMTLGFFNNRKAEPGTLTQLVYGMYSTSSGMMGYPDASQRIFYLTRLNIRLAKDRHECITMFVPQNLEPNILDVAMFLKREFGDKFEYINMMEFGDIDPMEEHFKRISGPGKVILFYTGPIQYQLFDYMMKESKLPVVAEGCSTRETAASVGIPLLHFPESSFQPYIGYTSFICDYLDRLASEELSAIEELDTVSTEDKKEFKEGLKEIKGGILQMRIRNEDAASCFVFLIEGHKKIAHKERSDMDDQYPRYQEFAKDSANFVKYRRSTHLLNRPDSLGCALEELEIDYKNQTPTPTTDLKRSGEEGSVYDVTKKGFYRRVNWIHPSRVKAEESLPAPAPTEPQAAPAAGPAKESSHGTP